MATNQNKKPQKLPSFIHNPSILLVVAPYHEEITNALKEGATAVLRKVHATIEVVEVPGALEIPTAILFAPTMSTPIFSLSSNLIAFINGFKEKP